MVLRAGSARFGPVPDRESPAVFVVSVPVSLSDRAEGCGAKFRFRDTESFCVCVCISIYLSIDRYMYIYISIDIDPITRLDYQLPSLRPSWGPLKPQTLMGPPEASDP